MRRGRIENEVVPLVAQRPGDRYAEDGALLDHGGLGNEALLIRRQH
jgi:hypothetical protein